MTAPRMLVLNEVGFVPGCLVFDLERPLFLDAGDRLWAEDDGVVVMRVSGKVERPAGGLATVRRGWQLL